MHSYHLVKISIDFQYRQNLNSKIYSLAKLELMLRKFTPMTTVHVSSYKQKNRWDTIDFHCFKPKKKSIISWPTLRASQVLASSSPTRYRTWQHILSFCFLKFKLSISTIWFKILLSKSLFIYLFIKFCLVAQKKKKRIKNFHENIKRRRRRRRRRIRY